MGERKTIELNIPRTAEERAKASNEWHCAGCGAPVPDLVKRCDCSTMVACKEGFKSVWMIDPNESPCVINLRNCQTQLDADGCQVGVSRQALEETLADYSRLRAEVERMTKERDGAFFPTDADDYWKNAIGGPYTPRKLRKHEAANAATIRRVIQDAPDECADVIASLVFFSCAATEREKFLVEDANSRAQSAEARLAILDRLAATGTAESFLQCDDAIKKFVFADWIEESARKKKAERERDDWKDAARSEAERVNELTEKLNASIAADGKDGG